MKIAALMQEHAVEIGKIDTMEHDPGKNRRDVGDYQLTAI